MSDKMNSIKFLSSIRAPYITTDKLRVKGNLDVEGAITTTNYEETIVKDAFQIFNSGNLVGEQFGEVILTGNGEYACSEYAHFSYDPTTLVECINQLIEIHAPEASQGATYLWNTQIQGYNDPYIPYYMSMRINRSFHNEDWYYSIELEDDFDREYKTVFSAHQNMYSNKIISDYPVYENQYDSEGNPLKKVYLDQVRIFGVGGADIPIFNRMIEIDASASMQHPQIYSYAYGIIYDSELDSVRLGEGMYTTDWDTGKKQFAFNAGEGLPLAIRDLTDDDNGRLVKWDAERHCLVKANSEDYVTASSIEEGTDGYFDIYTASGASEANINLQTKVLGGSGANVEINATEADSRVQILADNIGLQGNATLNDKKILTEGDIAETEHQVAVTWGALKILRDSGELIPGMFYRITDYVCTTTQEDTRATDHRFDIIVQALSESTLSENASADYHINEDGSTDGYFATSGFRLDPSYELLEDETGVSDTENYHSHDIFIDYGYAENPDGVEVPVLYKTDINTYPNEADYYDIFYYSGTQEVDGITYDKWRKIDDSELLWDGTQKRYVLTEVIVTNNRFNEELIAQHSRLIPVANLPAWELKYSLDNDKTRFAWADTENGTGVIYWMKDEHSNECPYDFKNIQFIRKISTENGYPEYDEENGTDTWVYTFCGNSYHSDNDEWSELKDGSLESPYYHQSDEGTSTFYHNVMGAYIKIYDDADENPKKCGKQYLNNNVFLGYWDDLSSNHHDSFYYAYCCNNNTFGNNCYSNTFGNDCSSNTFGNYCYSNTFGNDCYSNTFGNDCSCNTFGNDCSSNTFGNDCSSNTFGNYCYSNTFVDSCNSNTFGNYCYSNTFGNDCYYNTFCLTMTATSAAAKMRFIRFEDDCAYLKLTANPESSAYAEYITVKSGVRGTDSRNRRSLTVERGAAPVVFEAPGTTHIILD